MPPESLGTIPVDANGNNVAVHYSPSNGSTELLKEHNKSGTQAKHQSLKNDADHGYSAKETGAQIHKVSARLKWTNLRSKQMSPANRNAAI